MPTTRPLVPLSGLLCRRVLAKGAAWVGMLQLPPDFVPTENVAYPLLLDGEAVRLLPTPLDEGLEGHAAVLPGTALGIGDVIGRPVWPKPTDARVLPVRFLTAFPEDNRWSVYGPSPFPVPNDEPAHRWWSVNDGTLSDVAAPFDAAGMGFAQILTVWPVWPGPDGQRYTLPQTPVPWRSHWLRYHELLAEAADDDTLYASLRSTIAQDPHLQQLNSGQPDRLFCRYLARLRDEGLLVEDRPQSAEEQAQRERVLTESLEGGSERNGRPSKRTAP